MRRLSLGILIGAVLAIPASLVIAVAGFATEEAPSGVPVSQCPEAVAAFEELGRDPGSQFVPNCPEPSDIQFEGLTAEHVLGADRACKTYDVEPTWCPSEAEVAAADREVGGE